MSGPDRPVDWDRTPAETQGVRAPDKHNADVGSWLAHARASDAVHRMQLRHVTDVAEAALREAHRARRDISTMTVGVFSFLNRTYECRAALVRAGGHDAQDTARNEHHGPWSPRRCYLSGQAVTADGATWLTLRGARRCDQPGKSRRWRRLDEPLDPAKPAEYEQSILTAARQSFAEPPAGVPFRERQRRMLFQQELLEIAPGRIASVEELDARELAHGVATLVACRAILLTLDRRWQRMLGGASLLPCPPYAYATARDWLDDTPLIQALRRRGHALGQDAGPDRRADDGT